MNIHISKAIKSLGNYEFVVQGEVNSEEDWNNNVKFISGVDENGTAIFSETKPITYAEVLAEHQKLQTEYDNKQYQRDRAEAYPSLKEQMDMQYWDRVNGTNNWETKIAEIKAQFPKPTT